MKYDVKTSNFKWSDLGNVEDGRESLGLEMPVVMYRLSQYIIRDVLESEYGDDKAKALFKTSGHAAGIHFAENILDLSGDLDFFISNLQRHLQELKIGILRVEKADVENMSFILTVSEDLDCSGLPIRGETVCDYDEGFIAGILERYSGKKFDVREIDCWATGDRTCRFSVALDN